MPSPDLAMNFNVFDQDAERQELQKEQVYINQLNAMITALQVQNADLTTRIIAIEKYIAAHP